MDNMMEEALVNKFLLCATDNFIRLSKGKLKVMILKLFKKMNLPFSLQYKLIAKTMIKLGIRMIPNQDFLEDKNVVLLFLLLVLSFFLLFYLSSFFIKVLMF